MYDNIYIMFFEVRKMNSQALAFRKNLAEQKNSQKKSGKLIILSGISGSGKSMIGDILVNRYHYIYIQKYITRNFRNDEKQAVLMGKPLSVRPVVGKYNEAPDKTKKQAFLNLRLPLVYINYDNYYGFAKEDIDHYLANGKNVVIIINDIAVIRNLKNLYGENCFTCYIHRTNPKNKDIFMQIAKQRGDTAESAEKRYQKAIKDFDRYTNNISLYDYTLLNTENGHAKLLPMLQNLATLDSKKMTQKKVIKQSPSPKIYAFIGNPGSGKDNALEIIRVQSLLHSIIMPKHTTRKRKKDDGEEIICPEDELFDMNSCDLIYDNYGSTYGINTQKLDERLKAGISSSLIVSKAEAIRKLQEKYLDNLVTIYIHGLSKEEYKIQQKDDLEDDYVKKRLEEYEQADELYYNNWLDFNHVIIANGDATDLKLQLDNIMMYYEEGRDWSANTIDNYLKVATYYSQEYKRDISQETCTKEETL